MFPDEVKNGYTSANEAIDREIIPALGDYVDEEFGRLRKLTI